MEAVENLNREKLTIDLVAANSMALILFIPLIIIFGVPYYFIWLDDLSPAGIKEAVVNISPENALIGFTTAFLVLILGIIAHELIHGISWAPFAKKGWKSIKFGVLLKMLTPYCHCTEPLKVKHYIFGAITPAIFLGILPSILALFTGDFWLLVFGIFFTIAAAGDFMIINLIRKENMDDLVKDHPSEAGCYIYRK